MLLYQRTGDVWNPKLSLDGRFVAFGGGGIPDVAPPTVRVVHIASGQEVSLGRGRAIHWFGPDQVTWVVEVGPLRSERWHATILWTGNTLVAMNVSATPDDPALVAGNEFVAANGHWASWLDLGKRLVYDGRVISTTARSVSMAGGYLAYVNGDAQITIVRNGTTSHSIPKPESAHRFNVGADGSLAYGYWGPTRVVMPNGEDRNLTVTPWRTEGPAWIVGGWAWTATARPSDDVGLVLGRPSGDERCHIIERFPAVALDVVIDGPAFIVAGADATGHLQVHRITKDAERRLVTDGGVVVVPPPPEQPEEPPKDTPVKLNAEYVETIFEFTAKFPCPGGNEDTLRETWTPRLIEQLTFTWPRAGFGWKARDRNAPPSSDVICIRSGGHTLGWDIIPGAGTTGWRLDPARAESINLDDQYFFELPPKNHIGDVQDPGEPGEPGDPHDPGPVPPARPTDLSGVIREFDETQNALSQLVMAVTMVVDATNRVGEVMNRIEAHDLVIANEIRIATAAIVDLRKRMDMAIKVKL